MFVSTAGCPGQRVTEEKVTSVLYAFLNRYFLHRMCPVSLWSTCIIYTLSIHYML